MNFGFKSKSSGKDGRSKAIDQQRKSLEAIGGKKVEAGWFESDRYKGKAKGSGTKGKNRRRSTGNEAGPLVAHVARWNEFGSKNVPARPFMRLAGAKFAKDRKQIQSKIAGKIVAGKITPDQALGQIGLAMEGYIVDSIKNGGWAPNAKSTEKRKGFNTPLIDTGTMFQTVSSKVSQSGD